MFRKKAQAAMEFLMTYGWAILVVLVAIGALAYFGVLSPEKFLPERCTGTPGMDCIDKATVTAGAAGLGTVEFVIKNNNGYGIKLRGATVAVGGTAVTVGAGGSCATSAGESVIDPDAGAGAAIDGDILMSHGSTAPLTPTAMLLEADSLIGNNQLIRIKLMCPLELSAGARFKDDIVLTYVNTETNIEHKSSISLTGIVN